jgi:glycosyltransferase involved in cell wall biosynthesis
VSDGISVILPNYNHGHLIRRALTALAKQNPDEIIVVDDGSTDGSLAILQDFARDVPIAILPNASNQGAVPALARGLAAASGRYIYFAAADDYVMPGFFPRALDLLRRHPAAGLFCGEAQLVDGITGRPVGMRPPVRPLRRAGFVDPAGTRALLARIDNWILTGSAVFRREAVIAHGLDVRLGSFADGYLARKVALTQGFCFAPEVVATWCVYRDSVSRRTALEVAKAREMLDVLPQRIAADPVFPAWYAEAFARRWRFAAARLALEEHPVDHELLAAMGAPSRLDRVVIRRLRSVAGDRLARLATLAWLWLRLRPTSLVGLAGTALARRSEHFRAKWTPVRRRKCDQCKESGQRA